MGLHWYQQCAKLVEVENERLGLVQLQQARKTTMSTIMEMVNHHGLACIAEVDWECYCVFYGKLSTML